MENAEPAPDTDITDADTVELPIAGEAESEAEPSADPTSADSPPVGETPAGPSAEQGDNEPEAEPATETEPEAEATGPGADAVEVTGPQAEVAKAAEPDAEIAEPAKAASPYDMPGDWYVIHSYSGYENKVKANLETRIQSMHMGDRIFEVHIPMEDVVEFKAGKKVTVPKKVFPGYILVRMVLDDDSWYAVRNTPGVTGFVAGNAQKPTPLSRREVERFLGVQEDEEKAKPRFKPEWEVGEQVRVVTGPFADFNGVIEDMNVDQQKVTVLVNIFGRDTPVELGFEDIQKS
jgi:transcriptional antiterminator NusG